MTLHPGLSRYHHAGLIVPVLAAFSPYLWPMLFPLSDQKIARVFVYGALTAGASYVLMSLPVLKEHTFRIQKALLLGLLTSEMVVFTIPHGVPSITMLIFFLFMYFFSLGVDAAYD